MTRPTASLEQSVVNGGLPAELGRPRLDSLTGLRGIAALCVFFHHTQFYGDNLITTIDRRIAPQGSIGVTFFFILSGFVLTWSMRDSDTKRAFWRRRFARVYPAYLVALLVAIALTPIFNKTIQLGPLLASLTGTQAWVPQLDYFFALNSVGWSLSCEAFFYLCFPFFVPALMRCSGRQLRFVQVVALGLILTATVASTSIADLVVREWFTDYFPAVRMLEFFLGCTAAVDFVRGTRVRMSLRAAGVLAVGAYLLAGVPSLSTYSLVVIPVVPILLLIMVSAQSDLDVSASILRNRYLIWAGEISFSFYLVHQLVIRYLSVELPSIFSTSPFVYSSLLFCISLPAGIALAAALHYIVEKPLERRIRNNGRPASIYETNEKALSTSD